MSNYYQTFSTILTTSPLQTVGYRKNSFHLYASDFTESFPVVLLHYIAAVHSDRIKNEELLQEYIMKNNNKNVMPITETGRPVHIDFKSSLVRIIQVVSDPIG